MPNQRLHTHGELEQRVEQLSEQLAALNERLITEVALRTRAELDVENAAFYDSLTGLPNRALFSDRLRQAMAMLGREPDFRFAVLTLGLDRLKAVNDSLGHAVGDELLAVVARRLKGCLRPSDTVARLGGDEFTILLSGLRAHVELMHIVERVQFQIETTLQVAGHELSTSASIGVVLSASTYEDPDAMLRDADTAMYHAKQKGKARFEIFESAMYDDVRELMELEQDLRHALDTDQLSNHYQPIVSLDTGEIHGFEALVRWTHPTLGSVSPVRFIPIAEDTGKIMQLGQGVFERACRDMKRWLAQGPAFADLYVSVNLSVRQLAHRDIVERFQRTLQEADLDARHVRIEITESVLMDQPDVMTGRLQRLKEVGFKLSLDDFGTGYSSLSYLHRFPIDTLKVDRTFVSQIAPGNDKAEIVRTIVALAHNLGMDVVAEGIETADQLEALRAMQCEWGQGYHFARPVPAEEAATLVAGRS